MISVRTATIEDSEAIAHIYNQGIEERNATFETEPRTAADIETSLRDRADKYPTVVAQIDGRIIAAAWCSEYRTRECYAGIAEFSVYTERAYRGAGAGLAVMRALISYAAERGLCKLVSRVFPENTASRGLLASLGFREVGIYRRHGRLDGEWRDCIVFELLIGEAA